MTPLLRTKTTNKRGAGALRHINHFYKCAESQFQFCFRLFIKIASKKETDLLLHTGVFYLKKTAPIPRHRGRARMLRG